METDTDFIPGEDLLNKINEYNEEGTNSVNLLENLTGTLGEDEQQLIRKKVFSSSKLLLGQNRLSDFKDYKGELPDLLEQLNFIYKSLNSYNDENLSAVISFFKTKDPYYLIELLSYLPLHTYLPNLVELMATMFENGDLNNGSTIENEILFQGFKRVFEPRLQKTLFSLLLYQYNLDKDLVQLKSAAWKLLNSTGRMPEAAVIMDSIQKGNIRLRKAKELLIQENLELNLNSEINTALPLLLKQPGDVLFPVYKAYFKLSQNPQLNLEKFFTVEYKLDLTPVKTLSQQLLTYKAGSTGEVVTKKLNVLNNAGYMNRSAIVSSVIREQFSAIDYNSITFPDELREVFFAVIGFARTKAWPVVDTAADFLVSAFAEIPLRNLNDMKLTAYCLGREFIAGVVKIKYRTDEIIDALAVGLVHLLQRAESSDNKFLADKKQFVCCSEFLYYGLWDTTLELYPNLMTAEKNINMLLQSIKKEQNQLEINSYEKILAGLVHEIENKSP